MSGDIFIKIDGIEGESADAKHKNEIHIHSVSWGVQQQGTFASGSGGGGAGKASFQDLHFTKVVDKSSPNLFLSCASGKHLKDATVAFRKAGGKQEEYMTITLSNVLISSFTSSDSGGNSSLTMENVSLNFLKFEVDYKGQNEKGAVGGSVKQGWDLSKNLKI